MNLSRLTAISGLVACSAFAYAADQETVQYDLSSPDVTMTGTGCKKDVDAYLAEKDGKLELELNGLYIELGFKSSQTALSEFKNCTIRVPVSIPTGYYVSEMEQVISGGFNKTGKTTVGLAVQTKLFDLKSDLFSSRFDGSEPLREPALHVSRSDAFGPTQENWYNTWCSPTRSTKGVFQMNIVMSASVSSTTADDLVVAAYYAPTEIGRMKLSKCGTP